MEQSAASASAVRPTFLLASAVLLGCLGEYLFSPGLLGLNVLLWTASLAAVVAVLSRTEGVPLRGEGRWLLPPALLFAGFVAWRASPALQAINIGAVIAILAIASFRMREGRVRVGAVTEYLWLASFAAAAVVIGFVEMVFRRLDWRTSWQEAGGTRSLPYVRALLIAIPVVVLFGALLASADAVFSEALGSLLAVDAGAALVHGLRAALWTWISAGFLYGVLVQEPEALPSNEPAPAMRLGPIEVGTVLGALDLLFLAFVVFQVRYLFGGADHVQVTDGLSYAEYARHGFFELLAVAALVLPLVLVIHWLLRDRSPVLRIAFRVLSATLILLLYVVIVSALERMRLYVDEYGLTQLRLYSTAVMVWLVIVFAWLAATVLREQRQRFAFGALAAGLLVVAALNVLNPDAFIVRTNVSKAESRTFDVEYADRLSPDATPTLIAELPGLPEGQRCELAKSLAASVPEGDGWRTWNLGREQARDALAGAAGEIESTC